MRIPYQPIQVLFGLLLASNLTAQPPQIEVGRLLSSSRNDLWVFGVDRDPISGQVSVELRSWDIPTKLWGATGSVSARSELLFSERPTAWDWKIRPASQLHGDFKYHLSKYDQNSAFAADWGMGKRTDGANFNEGAILRFESGHLVLIPNGIAQARIDHQLSENQSFVGMVGNRVFYFNDQFRDSLFFFDREYPAHHFKVHVPVRAHWSKRHNLESVEQVFSGNSPDEILAYAWVRYTGLSAYSRFSGAVTIDLRSAILVVQNAK